MNLRIIIVCLVFQWGSSLSGQDLSYAPDMVFGHRSITYKHSLNYKLSPQLRLNNLILFDTEYNNDENNIYFIRNTASLWLAKGLSANLAFGVKNPGSFGTFSLGVQTNSSNFSLGYTAGSTYQNGFSFEQALLLNYTPNLIWNIRGYVNLLATANIGRKGYIRGLQQLRIGMTNQGLNFGLAVNLDQFSNAQKTLENIGVFMNYKF
ncbi:MULTISPECIES: hypothetical protein [Flavobacteriaceae]|uniref:hypothetical protein n=1 Tax=Flavobacteriaceae TaxID=49546 RepID=UPI00234A88DF|nr:hypothetical protein [Muricauda sp. SP22]MDC6363173.1 hypothetical protein [Muricauda sp. SP22]